MIFLKNIYHAGVRFGKQNAMKPLFFIADVHLSPDNRPRHDLIMAFLGLVLSQGGDLYILGDLFEFWANNRGHIASHRQLFNKLRALTSAGLRVGFVYGNRDFLLDARTLSRFGVDFLGEEAALDMGARRLLLAHGHTLCAADLAFLRYKQRVWPLFRLLDRILPGPLENYLALKCIARSKHIIASQDKSRLRFSEQVLSAHFQRGIDVIVCGHAHRLENRRYGSKRFYALPPWEDAMGSYLIFNQEQFTLREFAL